jgi:hypothetical protein
VRAGSGGSDRGASGHDGHSQPGHCSERTHGDADSRAKPNGDGQPGAKLNTQCDANGIAFADSNDAAAEGGRDFD